jgi:hypothetical protein
MLPSKKAITPTAIILQILLITGLVFLGFVVALYRKTFIDVKIPVAIWIGSGLLITPFIRKLLSTHGGSGNILYHCTYSIIVFGGLIVWSFMAINYYSRSINAKEEHLPILSRSSMTGSKHHRNERKPTVIVNYRGMQKDLVFDFKQTDLVNASDSVTLLIREGNLGFDVIERCWVINIL